MKVSEVDEVIVTTIDQRKFSEKYLKRTKKHTATAVAEVANTNKYACY